MNEENFLNGLNEFQKQAVTYKESKSLLILAGAGSGKTKTLTHRIAYLISQGINPNNILALTFTNKAAKEMKDRLEKLLNQKISSGFVPNFEEAPLVCTFHSFGVRFLKYFTENSFNIGDRSDTQQIGKKICTELSIDSKKWLSPFLNSISVAKNTLTSPGSTDIEPYKSNLIKFYERYKEELKKQNIFDFDDLLIQPLKILHTNDEIREIINSRFQYILIDEYQDTNKVQYELLKIIVGNNNITAVGDDDQSIYGWRGADITNILNFQNDFPNTKIIKLEQNYRSTQEILDLGNMIISQNSTRHNKKLWTENKSTNEIQIIEHFTERDEAKYIIENILNLTQ